MMAKKKSAPKETDGGLLVVANNKKGRHEYEILNVLEAGIALVGSEVKSIRDGGLVLKDSYIKEKRGELYLVGCHISPYRHAPVDRHEPERERKLLLHRREIDKVMGQIGKKGLTVIPLRVYFKGGRCKIEMGVARGKQLHDKREDIKKREIERSLRQAIGRRG